MFDFSANFSQEGQEINGVKMEELKNKIIIILSPTSDRVTLI